jgi:hypothetical protein
MGIYGPVYNLLGQEIIRKADHILPREIDYQVLDRGELLVY